jgi:hypothetical protein
VSWYEYQDSCLSFALLLNPQIYRFVICQLFEFFSCYLFEYFSASLFLLSKMTIAWLFYLSPIGSWWLVHFLVCFICFPLIFSLWSLLILSSLPSILFLCPSIEFLVLAIALFYSKSSTLFFFIFYICWDFLLFNLYLLCS